MGETEDPRAALSARDVTTRTAAARDLARAGGWDDLPELVRLAVEDASSAVRLYAAAAAADIVARRRGAAGQQPLLDAEREQVHRWVRAIDPGNNPGLLMMLSSVADATAIDRLGRMLRDLRNGVRGGAAAALRRMALSGAPLPERLPGALAAWLNDARYPQDARVELAKLAGEAGFLQLEAELQQLTGGGGVVAEAAAEALQRLAARREATTWQGLWVADGFDVFEVGEGERPGGRLLISAEAWSDGSTDGSLRLDEGEATLETLGAARLVWAPRVRDPERHPALQVAGRTYWQVQGKDLVGAVDRWVEELGPREAPGLDAVAAQLQDVDGPLAVRARALLAWRAGRGAEGLALIEELSRHKKPRADTWYWLGRMAADQGHIEQARSALDTFLERAGKRAAYRREAEALRASLADEAPA